MIKKYWIYYLFIFSLIVFTIVQFTSNKQDKEVIEVKAINAGQNKWGYEIYTNHKLYIRQQNIPAIQGYKYFVSKNQALLVGNFVVSKLSNRKALPTITLQELDSLGIIK